MTTTSHLMPANELWVGEMRRVEIGDTPILVLRVEAGVFAFEDRCAHLGVPLSEGTLENCTLTCPAHRYQYDATTGNGLNPRGIALRSLRVREVDGQLLVDLEEP